YKPTFLDIQLEKIERDAKEVTIKGRKDKTEESPLSLRSIGVNEIQRNPGGNRDISKVIQSLPGVGSSVGFRNDIIIRGGGPAENRYYLDGMEIPNLNHFATQGANGGPVGILNVDFIQDVGYYAGSFPANRGNMLSSLFEFKMKNPRTDAWHGAFTLGTSDIGIRAEGPVNEKSALMVSIRRSYLQLLFKGIGLPFLPTYNDMQIKYKYQIDKKNEISYLMLGAYDVSKLNLAENETDEQKYILGYLPEQNQWSYVNGIVYKHYKTNSFQTVVLSRNMLNNRFLKYRNNDELQGKIWDYNSDEIENKLRVENTIRKDAWKINYGAGAEYVKYGNSNYNQIALPNGSNQIIDFKSNIDFFKYGVFGQVSRTLFNEDLTVSVGTRFDGNTYAKTMNNLFKQYSPRASVSYRLNERINLNANTGIYHQLPTYTMLGYRDANGTYVNRENNLRYIKNTHYVAGVEYNTKKNSRFTVEGFYKRYRFYPQSVLRGLSLANEGGDFGVVGNEAVTSASRGRSYGVELFAQQKLYKGFYGIAAVTLFRSEFTNGNSKNYVAS
ncbi:MAG: TonB-dependent receptor, partial [Chitinophagaceae bacterium]|nr:TonB-dependent receptor [Chitinophagaceae bacterium]